MQTLKEDISTICSKIATIGRDLKIWRSNVKECPAALLQDLTASTKQLQALASNSGLKDLVSSVNSLNQCVQGIIKSFQEDTSSQQFESLIRELVSSLKTIKTQSETENKDDKHEDGNSTPEKPQRRGLTKKLSYSGKKRPEISQQDLDDAVKKRTGAGGKRNTKEDELPKVNISVPTEPQSNLNKASSEPVIKEKKGMRRKLSYNKHTAEKDSLKKDPPKKEDLDKKDKKDKKKDNETPSSDKPKESSKKLRRTTSHNKDKEKKY